MTVTLATFMEVLDTSIANVALPHIAGSLSAGQDESTWVLTSYLVSNAIVLPISAWASDRVGRKRFYMACVLLFTLSSLLCGLSTSSASCREQAAEDSVPASRRSSPTPSNPSSAA
jgi:DHA2 family multidrug resistance protein